MAAFGELLAELRRDHGMKQEELAKKLYVSSSTISNYENGTQLPPFERIVNIADLFNVTTDYLAGRCSSPLPIDILEEQILPNKTAGRIIQDINDLSPERKQALAIILDDMKKLSAIIGEMR